MTTTLKRRKRLNPMSKRKIDQINGEYHARVCLCVRCGGSPHTQVRMIRLNNGQVYRLWTVTCKGGLCEICGKPAGNQTLHPHERNPRSLGGALSLDNSIMCHDYPCHYQAQREGNNGKRI